MRHFIHPNNSVDRPLGDVVPVAIRELLSDKPAC
jgi:hypothetical protein